jgi:hypothetical protein
MKVGMKGTLVKDANLKYDSYGSGRPDGQPTKTLPAGTAVEITHLVESPKPGQTHTVNVNGIGWIQADAISVTGEVAAATTTAPTGGALKVGMKGTLIKDANLKYDSYGSGRPDGQPTKTLPAGTAIEITHLVESPKPGQTHTVNVNGIGWIPADAVKV